MEFEKDDPGQDAPDEGQQDTPSTDTPETGEPPETETPPEAPPQQARGKDPTAGMSAEQQVDYWKKRYGSAQQGYERLKQQRGGLASKTTYTPPAAPPQTNGHAPVKSLDEVQTLPEFLELAKATIKDEVYKELDQQQITQRMDISEQRAKQAHNGEDGLPAYDELFDEYVQPVIDRSWDPKLHRYKVLDLLSYMQDPAEAAYTLGILLKYQSFDKLREFMGASSRDDLVKNINKAGKQAANVKGRGSARQVSTKLTSAEIDAMTPEAFEKELEKFKNANL